MSIALRTAASSLLIFGLTPAWGAPTLEKVATPPALHPLPMSAIGRVRVTPVGEGDGPRFGAKEYVSQWPGVHFETGFSGTELYFKVGISHEILHLVVDDQAPLILKNPEPGIYRLTGLANARHAVNLQIATESQSAPNRFGGFAIPDRETAVSPRKRLRAIEFIGDSHTVGYGNTSPKQTCSEDEVWETTDDTQSFAALAAAHFHAEYEVNAISGRGIVRNYNGFAADTEPSAYPYVLFDKTQPYDDPDWRPQVIVIALGTNDFSTPLHAGEKWTNREELHADYEATYVRFLGDLRRRNPSAFIILWATDLAGGEIASEEQRVIDRMKSGGEKRISLVAVEHLAFTGCHFHPSLADDRTISDRIIQQIDAQSGIWPVGSDE